MEQKMDHNNGSSDDEFFLNSSDRLYNRRSSKDSNSSDQSDNVGAISITLNVNAPIFYPNNAQAVSSDQNPNTSKQPKKNKSWRWKSKRICDYCKRKGENSSMYNSHTLRHPETEELMCPALLSKL